MFRLVLIGFILFYSFAFADNLQGIVTYTEQTARLEAFKDVANNVSIEIFKNYKKDKYVKENITFLKKQIFTVKKEPKRNINPFYALNKIVLYSVEYEDDINTKYYYNILGNLQKFEINDYNGSYPYRTIAYDKKGRIINITFAVSKNEAFIFDKYQKLLGHWFNNSFFDKNGNEKYQRILE